MTSPLLQVWIGFIRIIGVAGAYVAPTVGLVLLLVSRLVSSYRPSLPRAWLIVVGVFEALVGVSVIIGVNVTDALPLAFQGLFLLGLWPLFQISHRYASLGIVTFLATFTVLAYLPLVSSVLTWTTPEANTPIHRFLPKLSATIGEGAHEELRRAWRAPKGGEAIRLRLRAQLLEGAPGWDWNTSNQGPHIKPIAVNGTTATEFRPQGNNPYIFRSYDTGEPLSGRTFQAAVELKRAERNSSACGILALGERGGQFLARNEVCVQSEWHSYTVRWTAPAEAQRQEVDITINGFQGSTLHIRSASIFEKINNRWSSVGPLSPTGVIISIYKSSSTPSGPKRDLVRRYAAQPSHEWQDLDYRIPGDLVRGADRVVVVVEAERGTRVLLSPAEVRAILPQGEQPLSPTAIDIGRQKLWFDHPNIAGHTLASSSLILASIAGSSGLGVFGYILSILSILATGSRTATLAVCLGVPVIVGMKRWYRSKRWMFLVLLALGVVPLAIHGSSSVERILVVGEASSGLDLRLEIFKVGFQAFRENLYTGLGSGGDGFTSYWRALGHSRMEANHPHNFWLDQSVRYGISGLAAAIWLSAMFGHLAWVWGKFAGFTAILFILLMQVLDSTLFSYGVLSSVVLGLVQMRGIQFGEEDPDALRNRGSGEAS